MESYFKAAVSDLDKLLDEFEQNADELENNKIVNPPDSKSHLLSSELDYEQPKLLEPDVQENISSCTTSTDLSLSTQTTNVANFEPLNSEQNEKNVTGLDLLSMVDGGSSDKNQSFCSGRCSIPVCDLISDTGNLSHVKSNSECIQKLQPGDFQCSTNSLIGFDLALVSATACNSSVDYSAHSGTQQQIDEDTTLYNKEYNAAEKQSQLALKTDSFSEVNIGDSGGDQEKTETLNNNEVFNQIEQIIGLDRIPALITQVTLAVHSSKDEQMYEKLPCELLVDENSAKGEMIHGESGRQAISKEDKTEYEASILPKTYRLNNASLILPKEESLCVSSLQTDNMLELDKTPSTEENVCSPEQNTNATLSIVSTPEVSEDVQTSLSCLPLAVSICGSLVSSDASNGKNAQSEAADVISDITVHTEKHNNGLQEELFEIIEASEQDGNLNNTSQCGLGKPLFTDSEKVGFDNITSKCELFQYQDSATTSHSSLVANNETCSDVQPTDIGDRASVDLAIEEDIIGSDMLVSDAELDAFLTEHCSEVNHSRPLEEDTGDGLLESDVIHDNLIDTNKLNFRSDSSQAEMEFKKTEASLDNNFIVTTSEPRLGILVEKGTLQVQQGISDLISETASEISDFTSSQQMLHSGGARPKQFLNVPSKSKICSELSSPNTVESESQVINSTTPKTSLSDAKICSDSSFRNNNADTQSCLEGKDSVLPVISEPAKVVEQAVAPGDKQPSWVPDSEAPICMNCQAKFTFTKRRHHCRACGKVFCASCCNRKCKLQYLDKEARVCISCYESINKAQAFERMMSPTGLVPNSGISEYSTVSPLQEAQTTSIPYSVFKQPNGDGPCPKEQKRVWFADGILPNGEVADTTKLSSGVRRSPQEPNPVESPANDTVCASDIKPKDEMHVAGRTEILCSPASFVPEEDMLPTELSYNSDCLITAIAEFPTSTESAKHPVPVTTNATDDVLVSPLDYTMLCGIENCVSKEISLIPEDNGLPPLLLARGEKGEESLVEEHPSHKQVTLLLEEPNPLTFILNANLLVNVQMLSYCSERCWYFSTNGLHGLGQAEIIVILPCLPNEDDVPEEIFKLFINVYKDAVKGKFIGNLENFTFTEGFLGSKEIGGFLFVTPTFQKLDDLILPKNSFLCGILIQKQEVPWAKVFPIRLMLRLGAEYGVYPTPLTSIRHRKPLFGEIGHTVMNLLVDLRNYQYTLHTIDNLFIHMEVGRSCIKIPLRRYNEVMKVMNTSNEHVISIGASFSPEADSHLVCVQNDDGAYQTQANSATGHPRKITGASFVVFNGALKTSSGFLAKSSIVEDGIMVQITPETMDGLRLALRQKKDFRITCGKVDSGDLREYVDICWVENEEKTNVRVTSPIDGKSMEGVQSEKIVQEEYFEMDNKLVKCTEVFYLLKASESYSHAHQFAKEIALASCTALRQHLKTLKSNGMNKIGLRVSMDNDRVEYQAGSGGKLLPQHYLNDLDSALIPVIHGGTSNATNLPLEMELIFFITESLLL
ncbi:zinc finger FYVE domain-containing protein 16-like isoform X2 [Rhineura floridana]|uniref:zinc finger FYVE domain-containing protein 16-like isoform X2 n=1 Tax=Rhineura floridana TaxID=261503 RepID=UPI002AC7F32B|nr:zinc finger FYVE domain-containing protein 16-like isoform X2 [Rhineura floridana]